jgi:hypothetical protein
LALPIYSILIYENTFVEWANGTFGNWTWTSGHGYVLCLCPKCTTRIFYLFYIVE